MQLKVKVISFFFLRQEKSDERAPPPLHNDLFYMFIKSPEELGWKFMRAYKQCTEQCYFQHWNSCSLAA